MRRLSPASGGGRPQERRQDVSRHKELLADPAVDVVCIATPDRHHAPQAIDAVRAGKDVYCEKPLTHWSQMDLARQLRRGRQEATSGSCRWARSTWPTTPTPRSRKLIKDGIIGKIVHVQAGYFRRGDWGERMGIPDPNAKPGPDLDWEQFLGDAPQGATSASRGSSNGGSTGTTRAARPPICWSTSSRRSSACSSWIPERVLGGGGNFQYDREVPDQCNIIADYAGGPTRRADELALELHRHRDHDPRHQRHDHLDATSPGIRIVPIDPATDKEKEEVVPWNGMGDTAKLWANLLECVKTRQPPFSPIDIAVRVQAPLNMGILSHRENKVALFDAAKQTIIL